MYPGSPLIQSIQPSSLSCPKEFERRPRIATPVVVAWLVFDPRGEGTVATATQLFGRVSFGMFWRNGYEALRVLDDNQDGALTGVELRGLAPWRDENVHGVSERGEVKPLAE
jgi:hypothetical protein